MISIVLLVPVLLLFLHEIFATAVTVETFPGASTEKNSGDNSGDSAPAISADISAATGLWVDSNGDTFFVDYSTNLVRKMDTSGIITTIGGSGEEVAADRGGPFTSVSLLDPWGVVGDSDFLYVSEASRVWQYNRSSGIATVYAGTKTTGSIGNGGAATAAQLSQVCGMWLTDEGELYITEYGNNWVRVISSTGIISAFAGGSTTSGYGGDGGPATSTNALLASPQGVYMSSDGTLYIAERGNEVIRSVSSGIIDTFAGKGSKLGDGWLATETILSTPFDVKGDSVGNIYILEGRGSIRVVGYETNLITTLANGFNSPRSIWLLPNDSTVFIGQTAYLKTIKSFAVVPSPTVSPTTRSPTAPTTPRPTKNPTPRPTTYSPTFTPLPTVDPTGPTAPPSTSAPTAPTAPPSTSSPTYSPTFTPLPTASPVAPTAPPSTSSPTYSPTFTPLPTASPVAPTAPPSTSSPTYSPTFTPLPTASPVAPTAPPSTSSPTYSPTFTPLPTASPVAPTASPSTLVPTVLPSTIVPSFSPSLIPSFIPSFNPSTAVPSPSPSSTLSPSRLPSTVPTRSPTILPTASPSALPSLSPTAADDEIVKVSGVSRVKFVNGQTLNAVSINTLLEAFSNISVNAQSVEITSTVLVEQSQTRRILITSSSTYDIGFVSSYIMSYHPGYKTTELATLKSETIRDAVEEGQFENTLRDLAKARNATQLLNGTCNELTTLSSTIVSSSSSSSSKSGGLHVGWLALVIIGCVVFATLQLSVILYFHKKKEMKDFKKIYVSESAKEDV